jgi:hypothetical protein
VSISSSSELGAETEKVWWRCGVTEAEAEAPAGKVAEAEGAGPEGICMALWKKSLMRVWAGGDAADEVEVDGCGSVIGMVGREGGKRYHLCSLFSECLTSGKTEPA